MRLLEQHWTADPSVVALIVLSVVHAVGARRRIRAVRNAGRPAAELLGRAACFQLGIALLVVAIASPVDYWSEQYLTAHMVQHILLAFVVPPLLVLGNAGLTASRGLPAGLRGPAGQVWARWHRSAPARLIATQPWLVVAVFCAYMVLWHLPGPYDLALRNTVVHIGAEHMGLFLLGVALWSHLLGQRGGRPALSPLQRVAATFMVNTVMVLIAMTLVLFSHTLYAGYHSGPHAFLSQYSDQQVAGSILWVCGEFTLAPTIYWNVQLWLRAQTAGRSGMPPWSRRERRWAPPRPYAATASGRPE